MTEQIADIGKRLKALREIMEMSEAALKVASINGTCPVLQPIH